jgi:hypothetical protein
LLPVIEKEAMDDELRKSLRCRNYAEELKMIATVSARAQRTTLLGIADSYEEMAASLEAIHRSRLAIKTVPS